MSLDPHLDRSAAAQLARADAEAKRILQVALQKAAILQVETSKEVEASTRQRIEAVEREVAGRLASADREAAERIRQAVATATALLVNAHREAEAVREELAAARAEAEAIRHELAGHTHRAAAEAAAAAGDTVPGAAALDDARGEIPRFVADAVAWSERQRAAADEQAAQRLREAEDEARAILAEARAEAARMRSFDEGPTDDRGGHGEPDARREPHGASSQLDLTEPARAVDEAAAGPRAGHPRLMKTVRVVALVVAAVVGTDLVRSCVAQPYTVASTSMEPEFRDGDHLVVNKLAYRFGDVGRGDVVVVDTTEISEGTRRLGSSVVKRVIGMPGDVVEAVDGRVRVNGEVLDEPYLHGMETDAFGPVGVPNDALFVMGDERSSSLDSRSFGTVPLDAIIGRVDAVIWPPGHAGPV